MSGPKCAKADLEARRQAELRRQRERERRLADARAACLADERRVAGARAEREEALRRLDDLRSRVEALAASASAGAVAAELEAWAGDCARLDSDLARCDAELLAWEQRFAWARDAWRASPERYDRVQPSTVRFDDVARLATIYADFGDRLARLAASRQRRDERETREAAERVRAAAEARAEIERRAADLDRVRARVDDTLSDVADADREFLAAWAPGALGELEAEARALRADLDESVAAGRPTRDADAFDERCDRVRALLASTRDRAEAEHASEAAREVVVDALIDALDAMHFNVSARLEREGDLRSDVLIRAGHPSGQEVALDVQADRTVRMQLEDGVRGADCVADALGLVEALREAGVSLEMTDWGTADPDRVRASRRQPGAASARGAAEPAP
jgi:hypothetical protein